ncbi:MAG: hypothetical protein N3I86_11410 [Verrucomicrobiae bacterium]|nr:hypothetical protein [Verrucomicrobiae bacterium]
MLAALASAKAEPVAGPLFAHYRLTLEPGERTEALGPFWVEQRRESEQLIAVPPLFSLTTDAATESREFDFLYPLLTLDRYGSEYRWQLLQLLSWSGGRDQDGDRRRRFTLFPLYFQQRGDDPADHYTALFPFYGTLRGRLLRDEIHFVLFPLYSRTRKKDVVTENYLYPVVHVRRGEGLRGWQLWPLAGREHKEVTWTTNGFGEVEVVGGHDKAFVLWPVFLDQTTGLGTTNVARLRAVLPLYSSLRSTNRDSTTVLWPLLTWTEDRERGYREWDAPWPLIVFARGAGKTTSRVWPFFSHAESTNLVSEFYFWPLYKYNRFQTPAMQRERTRWLFFLYSELAEVNWETGARRERRDLWPLWTWRRDFNGNTRLQLLAPLEPVLPNNKSIERNWSPLWALWRAETNPRTGASSRSLLWNFYRSERTPDSRKCSLLFGLFQYHSDAQGRRVRLFYVPLSRAPKHSGHVSEHR